jgi:excisionase family DNA binding protein
MKWLSCNDLANELGMSSRTIQHWCRERKIPHHRLGRTIRFSPQDVEAIKAWASRRAVECHNVDVPNPVYAVPGELVPFPRRGA